MKAVLQFVPGNSFFHKLHPITKILWAILFGILCFICQNVWFLASIAAINLIIFLSSGIARESKPIIKVFGLICTLLLFFSVFFNRDGIILFEYGFIIIKKIGILQGLVITFRTIGALMTICIMIMLTPANDLAAAVVKHFRVPYKYAFAVTATLRFIPMLTGEMSQIIQAQISRGCDLDRGGPIKRFSKMVPLTIPLLSSSVKKTEQMAMSLEVRGFGSGQRSSYRNISFGVRDLIILIMTLTGYAVGILINIFI
jgi:energy-coupling factor transport system permease protein